MKSFDQLMLLPSLVLALAKENILAPTDIQKLVIPKALEHKDLIVQSQTGTGKTLAYLLPIFQHLQDVSKQNRAIILVPTHELALQVHRQIEQLRVHSGLALFSACVIGNVNIKRQVEKLKEKPQLIVGSPGRILELIQMKKISAHTVSTIVVDEADKMMDKNNIASVKAVIKCTLKERQLMLFSASISKEATAAAREMMKNPEVVSAATTSIPSNISHLYFIAEMRDKTELLRKLLRALEPPKAMVFINQPTIIEREVEKLKYHGFAVDSIHGANDKLRRKKTMDDFASGKLKYLIASDIGARGLHMEGITCIINISIPQSPNDYLHRVGRAGRDGQSALAISIITPQEMSLIKAYEKAFHIKIEGKTLFKGQIMSEHRNARSTPASE